METVFYFFFLVKKNISSENQYKKHEFGKVFKDNKTVSIENPTKCNTVFIDFVTMTTVSHWDFRTDLFFEKCFLINLNIILKLNLFAFKYFCFLCIRDFFLKYDLSYFIY